jgi:UDP-N-acetylmuramoyl-tripeptide--D-alanyl-D-alanine ligase
VLAQKQVDAPAVLVDDSLVALAALAAAVLDRLPDCHVVGVTGSSGKTSTKDLLAQVYERRGPTVAPANSFNNEVGFPLTVLRADDTTRTLVCEYGARGPGHIAYLTEIARPRTAIVLNVGAAHLGEFGSRQGIAAAKSELVAALAPDGRAVLNADDELVLAMRSRTAASVTTFGSTPAADVQVTDIEEDALSRPRFVLHTPAGDATVQLKLHGRHQAVNAAAVAAAALCDGIALDDVTAALEQATARSPHRMDVLSRADGLVVVDDAYNANPESTKAAIDALRQLSAGHRRAWAVLGEMRELGAEAAALHEDIGRYAARAGLDEIVAVGPAAPVAEAAAATDGWGGRARVVDDVDAAIRVVVDETRPGDVVLVKASNSIRAWRIAEALLAVNAEVTA